MGIKKKKTGNKKLTEKNKQVITKEKTKGKKVKKDYGFGTFELFGKEFDKIRFFNTASICIIVFFILFYGGRLAYYLGKQIAKQNSEILLCDKIIEKESVVDLTTGLVKNEDGSYTVKGNADDNYIVYSDRMFRIVGIDSEKNVKIISDKAETVLINGIGNEYSSSVIRKWLNELDNTANSGIYFKTLNDGYGYLTNTNIFTDKIDSIDNITHEELVADDYVTLLSLNDYKEAGGANSYLNNSEMWFLSSTSSSGLYWYVSSDGGLSIASDASFCSGIRPVLTIKNSTFVVSGEGTKANPYRIEKDSSPKTLANANVGKLVSYGGYTWKIIEKDENKVKLAFNGYVMTDKTADEKAVTSIFGKSVKYSAKDKKSVGYYLNNDFYKTLTDTSLLVKDKWYNGKFTSINSYSYLDTYKSSYNGYVGMLKIGDMFLNDFEDTFTITAPYGDDKLIYTVNTNNALFADFISKEHKIRPAIYVDASAEITQGDGSSTPYEIQKGSVQNQ